MKNIINSRMDCVYDSAYSFNKAGKGFTMTQLVCLVIKSFILKKKYVF